MNVTNESDKLVTSNRNDSSTNTSSVHEQQIKVNSKTVLSRDKRTKTSKNDNMNHPDVDTQNIENDVNSNQVDSNNIPLNTNDCNTTTSSVSDNHTDVNISTSSTTTNISSAVEVKTDFDHM